MNLLGACTTELKKKRELLVIVEYCRFGNLQKYMMTHRSHFINQLQPSSQEVNFSIGQEIIWGFGGDLPKVRQEYELSARYYGQKKSSGGTSNSSRQMIMLQNLGQSTNATESNQVAASHNEGFTSDGGCFRKGDVNKKGQKLSVRYTENPGMFSTHLACTKPIV